MDAKALRGEYEDCWASGGSNLPWMPKGFAWGYGNHRSTMNEVTFHGWVKITASEHKFRRNCIELPEGTISCERVIAFSGSAE